MPVFALGIAPGRLPADRPEELLTDISRVVMLTIVGNNDSR